MIMRYYVVVLLQVLDHEIIMHHRRVLLLLFLLLQLLCMKKLDLQVALRLVTKEEVGKEGSNAVEESIQEENLLIQPLLDQAWGLHYRFLAACRFETSKTMHNHYTTNCTRTLDLLMFSLCSNNSSRIRTCVDKLLSPPWVVVVLPFLIFFFRDEELPGRMTGRMDGKNDHPRILYK